MQCVFIERKIILGVCHVPSSLSVLSGVADTGPARWDAGVAQAASLLCVAMDALAQRLGDGDASEASIAANGALSRSPSFSAMQMVQRVRTVPSAPRSGAMKSLSEVFCVVGTSIWFWFMFVFDLAC